jgi:ATP diphosphatase
LEIMAALRDPASGCPWDLEQDFASIAPYTIEEAYEVADCIERGALGELPDELGDLLLQVVFHAQIAQDRKLFSFADVVDSICRKMIRRHPHVFGVASATSPAEVTASWDAIKREERPERSVLEGIALSLPALARALKLGRRAASVGFDWPGPEPVRRKLTEELGELDGAIAKGAPADIAAELGDLLFTVVNLCRHLEVDPEQALRGTNERFTRRFARVESAVAAAGGDWSGFTAEDLERLWTDAKLHERG